MSDDILLNLYLRLDRSKDAASASAALDGLAQWVRTEQASNNESWQENARDCLYAIAARPALFVTAISQWLGSDDKILLGKALSNAINGQCEDAMHPATALFDTDRSLVAVDRQFDVVLLHARDFRLDSIVRAILAGGEVDVGNHVSLSPDRAKPETAEEILQFGEWCQLGA